MFSRPVLLSLVHAAAGGGGGGVRILGESKDERPAVFEDRLRADVRSRVVAAVRRSEGLDAVAVPSQCKSLPAPLMRRFGIEPRLIRSPSGPMPLHALATLHSDPKSLRLYVR